MSQQHGVIGLVDLVVRAATCEAADAPAVLGPAWSLRLVAASAKHEHDAVLADARELADALTDLCGVLHDASGAAWMPPSSLAAIIARRRSR